MPLKTKNADNADTYILEHEGDGSVGDPFVLARHDPTLAALLAAVLGEAGDAAATAGGTGTASAKLRLLTSQLNTLAGYLDGVETALAALALESGGNLAAIATDAAAIEALLTTIDGDTGNLAAILTALQTLAGAVAGTEVQADVLTLPALPAGNNNIGDVDIASIAAGNNNIGDVDVASLPALAAGSNIIGNVRLEPRTSGGLATKMCSGSDGSTALTATAQEVKASAGQVFGYYIYNPNATAQFVHFYNVAQGSVTVGTTNPLFTLTIPAESAANLMGETGIEFGTAISIAATATAGGNGAPGTALDAVVWYK